MKASTAYVQETRRAGGTEAPLHSAHRLPCSRAHGSSSNLRAAWVRPPETQEEISGHPGDTDMGADILGAHSATWTLVLAGVTVESSSTSQCRGPAPPSSLSAPARGRLRLIGSWAGGTVPPTRRPAALRPPEHTAAPGPGSVHLRAQCLILYTSGQAPQEPWASALLISGLTLVPGPPALQGETQGPSVAHPQVGPSQPCCPEGRCQPRTTTAPQPAA